LNRINGRQVDRDSNIHPCQIRVFPGLSLLSTEAAKLFVRLSTASVRKEKRFSVALAGGSTPQTLYHLLASPKYREQIPWRETHLFWGDERCVPPSHRDSNYRTVQETLLTKVPIPLENIHRMQGEVDPGNGAGAYEQELREFFLGGSIPHFDLLILGLGKDGHTASLFPGSPCLEEGKRLVVPAVPTGIKHHRLTLTLPVINQAGTILFLAAGKEKAEIVSQIFQETKDFDRLPARRVKAVNGELYWFLDEEAAALLKRL
jgi:6-phosphogluconolactonase